MTTADTLAQDIIALHDQGYRLALDNLPSRFGGPRTGEPKAALSDAEARAALRAAGFSDAEIDDRDYSRAAEHERRIRGD